MISIFEFADIIKQDLVIRYYSNQKGRFCVNLENCEVSENICLASVHGNGKTVDAAINDYISKIKGKTIVFEATSERRKEFGVPDDLSSTMPSQTLAR